jgi:hypothetical protein
LQAKLSGFSLDLGAIPSQRVSWDELLQWPRMGQLAEAFEVSRILMHRDVDDAVKNGEDFIVGFLPSLVLQIFVPERV